VSLGTEYFASVRGFHKALHALVNGGANATFKNSKGEDPSCLATGMTKEFLINPLISDLEALVRGQVDTEHVVETATVGLFVIIGTKWV
jgi:hypothetical protein